jgi:hypothetical protein
MTPEAKTTLTALAFILILICGSIALYSPGTSGGFLLDDFSRLSPMKDMGEINNLASLQQYTFHDVTAETSGRPISFFTMALDGNTWPTDPAPFKWTNILFHSSNALVIFGFFFAIFTALNKQRAEALNLAFFTALLWAIHPLQVSTVLYVIQRMTELSCLFMFSGLWCYIHGRSICERNPGAAYIWMSAGVLVFGALAFFSKENGALLPLFILITEFTLLSTLPRPKNWHYWAIPFLIFPLILILIYFGVVISDSSARFANRDFTLYERLLTESRVVIDYILNIFLPLKTPTLYHDDFVISKSLTTPFTTLLSVATILCLLAFALIKRLKQPILSFAILWFFGAQLIESTVIPLEIYFEHRNYFALAGPALALAYYLQILIKRKFKTYATIAALLVIGLAITTVNYSDTWGDPLALASVWTKEHPDSSRSRREYINQLYISNRPVEAFKKAQQLADKTPSHVGNNIMFFTVACIHNRLTKKQYLGLLDIAAKDKLDDSAVPLFNKLFEQVRDGNCKQINLGGVERIGNALLQNKNIKTQANGEYYLYRIKSEINFHLRRFKPTLQALLKAFELRPSFDLAIRLAYLHAGVNQFGLSERYLHLAEALDRKRNPLLPTKIAQLQLAEKEIALKKSQYLRARRK